MVKSQVASRKSQVTRRKSQGRKHKSLGTRRTEGARFKGSIGGPVSAARIRTCNLRLVTCALRLYFPAAAAFGGSVGRTAGDGPGADVGVACAATAASMNRPKIILPAVVCRTLVTTTSIVLP